VIDPVVGRVILESNRDVVVGRDKVGEVVVGRDNDIEVVGQVSGSDIEVEIVGKFSDRDVEVFPVNVVGEDDDGDNELRLEDVDEPVRGVDVDELAVDTEMEDCDEAVELDSTVDDKKVETMDGLNVVVDNDDDGEPGLLLVLELGAVLLVAGAIEVTVPDDCSKELVLTLFEVLPEVATVEEEEVAVLEVEDGTVRLYEATEEVKVDELLKRDEWLLLEDSDKLEIVDHDDVDPEVDKTEDVVEDDNVAAEESVVEAMVLAELLLVVLTVELLDVVRLLDVENSVVAVLEVVTVVFGATTGAVKAGLTVVVCSTTAEHRLPAIAPITTWAQFPEDGAGKPAKSTPSQS
jgi:hypothetical protein